MFALVSCLCASAAADQGELGFGAVAGYATPEEARLELGVGYGLTDFLALRGRGGAALGEGELRGLGTLELVFAWDVLTWVPELALGVGASLGYELAPRFSALAALRRYLGLRTSLGLAGGVEWDDVRLRGLASLVLWFD